MHIDAEFLSRIQFAFTIAFHILFPAFSIGMATFLAIMEGVWLKTNNPKYLSICKFWTKIFALTFGMGVVSGIVMAFQLGTNWSGYTYAAGPVLGVLFTYEVLTAFFIEAGFLGVMIFGWDRVGPKLHYLATLLVVIGVTLSAFWILSANSWMQTPDGVNFVNGRFVVNNWWHVIFNHSVVPRFIHMMLAAWITTLLVIAGVHAYYLLKKAHVELSKSCLKFALVALMVLVPVQMYVGDTVGLEVHQYQPLKTAAMEAVWQTQKGAPLLLFTWPDQKEQKNLFAIGIPHLASLLNTHEWNGKLVGLKSVPRKDQPFVPIVFFSFRIMVGIGVILFFLAYTALVLLLRKRLYESRWFLKTLVACSPLGFIAIITGWFTAEVGRQPWVVYDYLRTTQGASRLELHNLIISLILIIVVYGIIFGVFYFKYLLSILHKGPTAIAIEEVPFIYMPQTEEGKA